jgi:hypothetical protein
VDAVAFQVSQGPFAQPGPFGQSFLGRAPPKCRDVRLMW